LSFAVHNIIDFPQPKEKGEKRESKPRPQPRSHPRLPVTPHKISSTNPAPSEVNEKVPAAVPSRASRLIIRNLPFNATEQDLRDAFLPYGPIYSIQIPTDDKTTKKDDVPTTATANRKVRTKGFAFVWMSSKKDAVKAIEGCNGITVRAGTAEPTDDKRATERVIAVDWALSKEKWEVEKAKIEEDAAMHGSSESEDDAEDGNSNSSEESSDDGDEGHLGLHTAEEEDNSNAGSEDEENDEERVKPQLPQPEAGTTLFIRNIPFNATEDELRTL
jgi:nucleolar protein 4